MERLKEVISKKNDLQIKKKKYSSPRQYTVSHVDRNHGQNGTLNCFRIHRILQIKPSASITSSQTSKKCPSESDVVPMKR